MKGARGGGGGAKSVTRDGDLGIGHLFFPSARDNFERAALSLAIH